MRQSLPYRLTGGQERVLEEIYRDMESPNPMRRLLQGDVGSGKTVIAWLSALRAMENGRQALLLAPTELLAEQHYERLQPYAEESGRARGAAFGGLFPRPPGRNSPNASATARWTSWSARTPSFRRASRCRAWGWASSMSSIVLESASERPSHVFPNGRPRQALPHLSRICS